MSLVFFIHFFPLPCAEFSKALSVGNGRSTLGVPLLQDPHLLEGGEVQSDSLLLQAVSNAGVLLNSVSRHDGDGDGEQAILYVHATLHDRVVGGLMGAAGLHSQEAGLKRALGHLNLLLLMVVT